MSKGPRLRFNENRTAEPTLRQEINNKMARTLATGKEHATSNDRPRITARTVRDTNQTLPPKCCRYCGDIFDMS